MAHKNPEQLLLSFIWLHVVYMRSGKNHKQAIQMLYLVPRVIMGLLAIADTFLVYKIAERRYSRNVAVIASVLFAVTPSLLYNRWILLDNILLPFLLSSILFALYHHRKDSRSADMYDDEVKIWKQNALWSATLWPIS
jgi:4-amino-4-deoxy-L-arabinose transferase-like glycosyltransferase